MKVSYSFTIFCRFTFRLLKTRQLLEEDISFACLPSRQDRTLEEFLKVWKPKDSEREGVDGWLPIHLENTLIPFIMIAFIFFQVFLNFGYVPSHHNPKELYLLGVGTFLFLNIFGKRFQKIVRLGKLGIIEFCGFFGKILLFLCRSLSLCPFK